ncbi:putative lipid II flippase FtsW [Gordonia hydrophobica]|uniref:Probable peptidoglycan glycosyltransferase FtsW n=1 Tax=Gordonia hydrophobica TaxID=40516 RepID=A0ABZ2TYW0_9ACTN|nr:putative lipid II flippase FtsW [Gordonia hydrophobica]MBM7367113.1 cell division protein FtsW [Gordonia hydrophobica]
MNSDGTENVGADQAAEETTDSRLETDSRDTAPPAESVIDDPSGDAIADGAADGDADDADGDRTARRRRRRSQAARAVRTTPRASAEPEPLRRLRLVRGADVRAGVGFLVTGVRNLAARPLTSFHLVVSITVLLVGFGLMMVLSASAVEGYARDGSAYGMFTTQVMFVALGLVLFYFAARISVRTLQKLSLPILLIALVLLVAVMIPGIGVAGGGAQRWVSIAGLTFQPSEMAKLALCLWGAAVLSTRDPKTTSTWGLLVPLVPVSGIVAFLVIIERNQSTTMILGLIVATLLWFGGLRLRYFAAFMITFAVIGAVLALMWSYRAARVFSFLNGNQDVLGAGYQANQAKYALADGGLFGKGLGMGTAKWNYLPNAHNDFIFAVIGEEFGLVGGISVLGIYLLLGYAGLRIARRSVDPFLRLMSGTITVLLLAQAFINIGYVVGLLPVTGIQLPILSAGGSSVLMMLAMLGMLANAARHEPEAIVALSGPAPKGLARLLRLPKPQAYRASVAREQRRRPAPAAAPRRRPAPPRNWDGRGPAPAGAPRRGGRRTGESSSGEIHYRSRGARPSRSWQESRPSAPRERSRRSGRGEWESGRR